jgi:hypothetical protein
MKTSPGRPRGLTRLARALGLDRNPLGRATDRAEAWIRVGLLGIFLIAGPIAALHAGHGTYHAGITVDRAPAAPSHRAKKPAALRQAPAVTGLLGVSRGGQAGARVAGTGPSARAGEVLTAVMTLAAVALALLAVLRLALALLGRRRLASWETAWSRVGPQWSKHRP